MNWITNYVRPKINSMLGRRTDMKRGCPVVIGAQESETALQVLIETAERLECPTFVYGQDFLAFEENGRMSTPCR